MESNLAWVAMFRRLPVDLHDKLSLGLATGADILMQTLLKLEPDFIIIRGRLSGTQEGGQIMLIPYGQLTYVSLIKPLKDTEVEAIFGKGAPAAVADTDMPSPAAATAPPAEPVPTDAAATETPAPAKKPEQVSKTMLLAKLRERMKDAGQGGK